MAMLEKPMKVLVINVEDPDYGRLLPVDSIYEQTVVIKSGDQFRALKPGEYAIPEPRRVA